jgi:hypothetical protein
VRSLPITHRFPLKMLYEVLQIGFASRRANKLRSALTMLGIVIGIGSPSRWSR